MHGDGPIIVTASDYVTGVVFGHGDAIKGALYIIWCGLNRLGDSGVKVV